MKTSKTLFAALAALVLTAACSDAGPLAPEPSSSPAAHRTQANPEVTTTTTTSLSGEEFRCCYYDSEGKLRCTRRIYICSSAATAASPKLMVAQSERQSAPEPATASTTTSATATEEEGIDEEGRRCWIDLKTGAKRCRL